MKLNIAFYINIFFAAKKMQIKKEHHGLYFYEDHLKKIFNCPVIFTIVCLPATGIRGDFFHTSMILVFLKKSDCHSPQHTYTTPLQCTLTLQKGNLNDANVINSQIT